MPLADELARVSVTYSARPSSDWAPEIGMITWHLRHHHFADNTWDWHTELAALPGRLKSKFDAHWSGGMADGHWIQGEITQIKATQLDGTGHAVDVAALEITDGSLRGTGSFTLPPEVALAVSEYGYEPGTFTPNKGRKRGRFYLPYLNHSLMATDGKLDPTAGGNLLAGWQAFINDVQGMHAVEGSSLTPDYWDWVIASNVDATWLNVGWIALGNHFDVQRRRQHQSVETRSVAVITHS